MGAKTSPSAKSIGYRVQVEKYLSSHNNKNGLCLRFLVGGGGFSWLCLIRYKHLEKWSRITPRAMVREFAPFCPRLGFYTVNGRMCLRYEVVFLHSKVKPILQETNVKMVSNTLCSNTN